MLTGLAVADFRDRIRRPAYLVVLAAAVALGYVAVPSSDAKWMIMQVGDHRGIYNSAYVGMVTALAAGLWLTLGGFYIVRNSIERDRSTRVGQLLAATPLRTPAYMAGKFLSNLLLLASMLGVLAVTALVMQLARGESTDLDLVALWQPFALIALPLVALTAACALLFESLPVLRTGVGNILWFCIWLVVSTAGQGPGLPLDGIGVNSVVKSMYTDMVAQHIDVTGAFSLGLTYLDKPLGLFTWHGFTPTAGYVLGRVTLLLIAALVALLPTLWFGRFDPSRSRRHRPAAQQVQDAADGTVQPVFVDEVGADAATRPTVGSVLRTRPEPGAVTLRLWAGEIRILLQGVRWWWWLGAAFLMICGLTAPAIHGITRVMLPLSWIWPVLIWSRLGTQRHEHGVEGMLAAYPAVRRRVLAEWAAGLTVTVVAGIGPLIRLIAAGDWLALAGWTGGALFIPSLAMALGTLSRTHRLFQAVYVPLWYSVANGLPIFDFMGALRDSSELAKVQPPMTVMVAAALMAVVFAATVLRRFSRD
ncbi:ABC transporter permease [Streptomyces sp. NPDC020883]|uniref:ABC transporter permease n=1 Tax=unclassified Streptomyces TaxID=2593676 RepID=UPI0021B0CAFD|nr:ABC transporter permease [Streptomyces sp. BHT-5-2]